MTVSKINWGTGMAILFSTFAVFILGLVFLSASQSYQLVEKDYYDRELDYQSRIEQIKQSKKDPARFDWSYDQFDRTVVFRYNGDAPDAATGEIHFYRPSDSDLDFKVPVQFNDRGKMEVSMDGLKKGLWKIKASIEAAGTEYYKEDILIIEQ